MNSTSCNKVFCWIFSVVIWILIIGFIILYINNSTLTLVYPLIGFYIVYLVLEFCSATCSYLCNKSTACGMYEKMGNLYKTPPQIKFYCECYHYEYGSHGRQGGGNINRNNSRRRRANPPPKPSKGKRRGSTGKSSGGRSTGRGGVRTTTGRNQRRNRRIVVTHRDTFYIPYYSERDVSGLFYLNCDEAYIKRKKYIQLQLFTEVNFADPISYMDYMFYKNEFWRRNRFRDVYMKFNISRQIPGLVRQNLIKFGKGHCCMNFFWFFIYKIHPLLKYYK